MQHTMKHKRNIFCVVHLRRLAKIRETPAGQRLLLYTDSEAVTIACRVLQETEYVSPERPHNF